MVPAFHDAIPTTAARAGCEVVSLCIQFSRRAQRAALLRLVEVYAQNFQPELARAHLDRIRAAGVDRLHFAWAGSAAQGQSHYYRIHGPTHVIEYDNRGGNHIHTVFRDLDHDFGDGLLARHLHEGHGAGAHERGHAGAAPPRRGR